jgi:hypothetical protein
MKNSLKLLLAAFVLLAAFSGPAQGAGQSKTLTVLQAFPVNKDDREEPPEVRAARLVKVQVAIDSATPHKWERALLLSVAWYESNYRSHIQLCEMKGDEGKASGLWQTWALECPITIDQQATEAIRHLRSTMAFCRRENIERTIKGGVSLYATGKTCYWPGAQKRLVLWRKIMGRL